MGLKSCRGRQLNDSAGDEEAALPQGRWKPSAKSGAVAEDATQGGTTALTMEEAFTRRRRS